MRIVIAMAALLLIGAAKVPPAPPTAKHPVEDHYHGVTVHEDYRWLEDWNDPKVKSWSTAQNARTRAYLDHLPMRAAVLKRVQAITHASAPAWFGLQWTGAGLYAIKNQPPKQQPLLVRLGSADDVRTEHVVFDPNVYDRSGSTAMDFYEPTRDGALVAISLSRGGSESGTVHVFDGRTGRALADTVARVNGGTAGGSVAWNADRSGLYHTRYPAPGERPDADLPFYQQVWFHRIGTPDAKDVYVVGKEFPKIAEIQLSSSEDGRWVLADVLNGDGGEHAMWVAEAGTATTGPGTFHRVTSFADTIVAARFGRDTLYALSRHGHPNGRILAIPLATPDLAHAHELVPEPKHAAIEWFVPTAHELIVEEIVGGPSRVERYTLSGRPLGALPIPTVSTVGSIVHTTDDAVLVQRESYTEPPRWSRWAPGDAALKSTALVLRSPVTFDDIIVERVTATSKDGTKIPVNILRRRGTPLDGRAPALVTGYGGYGISQRPGFGATRRVWLDQGGIIAIVNTRGGGEFGDAWHRAGNLTHKQNVFDDFAAGAEWLVQHHYSAPGHMAAQGGSNGGLLMGAEITQHPRLFRAVVSSVGIYDMLRVELSPNGLFNTTEFGTVKNADQFRAMYAYSPYHHVKEGTPYPAVLFTTGANDPRVDPMNSRKMTARLQEATSAKDHPILLRTSMNTGHGIGSPLSERDALTTDINTFLFDQLGVKLQPPRTAPAPLVPRTEGVRAAHTTKSR